MDEQDPLTVRFQQNRPRLRAVAYRMLGSLSDADDALQEAWQRADRAGTARQLASRARRRVRDTAPEPDRDPARQRGTVDAFFAAARDGDLDALVAVLHPDVVLRADGGTARARTTSTITGARRVVEQAATLTRYAPFVRPVLVNGAAGALVAAAGRPLSVLAFTVAGGRIASIDVLADPARLATLPLPA